MKTITLCSSMAFYKDVLKIGKTLEKRGFNVLYPESALMMKERNDFSAERFKKGVTMEQRGKFMKLHFEKELKSHSILIVNKTKNGIRGYIGGNVLMEMGIAFGSNIKIYVLHRLSKNQPFKEEILGMSPVIINGKLELVT